MLNKKIDRSVFKAYDVRGLYPEQLNEELARDIGRAFVTYLEAKRIGVSRDMRLSSPSLAEAFIDGALAQGVDVVDYGMLATDMLYFGVARDGLDGGAQITASHNPKQYNGMKLVRKKAVPLSSDEGIGDICKMVMDGHIPKLSTRGVLTQADLLENYVEHVLSFIEVSAVKPFHLVLDAGSGMAGLVGPQLFKRLPCKTTRLCFDIDGAFPNHQANPLLEENRKDLVAQVLIEGADAGVAWDGDADRCFFVDRNAEFIAGDFITALLAEAFLRKANGEKIIYDVRASHAVKDIAARFGGTALMNRVGHAFFKKRMREENAVFGGEVTGHYYFRDNFFADNGFIPALLILELMSVTGRTLDELLDPLRTKYFISGEINTEMPDMKTVSSTIERLASHYSDGNCYRMDGFSVEYPEWHFNVRASNTEPYIRLNLEGNSKAIMEDKLGDVLGLIRD